MRRSLDVGLPMSPHNIKVPLVTRRRRVPMAAIKHFVDEIVKQYKPQRVILFGSYASGSFRPESDVDLLIVMETAKGDNSSLRIRQSIPHDFGLDLIVISPDTLLRRLELGDFFLREVMEQGKVIYESSDR
ncbi:MAG TPA: nucleotidyltransferase domain-containing protein [Gemmataceae bacterium]|nr:nucleotidyltransferase domain-containing protein [Gemmataceae bacterium]